MGAPGSHGTCAGSRSARRMCGSCCGISSERLEPARSSRHLSWSMGTHTLSTAPAPAELDRWRRDTPGCRDRIHLNNAGAALVPRLVGAAPRNIALVENATVAFSQALSAFDFRPGDRIVTSRTDYPSNQLTYLSLARRMGVETVRADDLPEGGVDPESVRRLAADPRTRVVALTWVPTNSGLVQDVHTVGRVCAELDVPFVVDACQSVGQLPVDVGAVRVYFLAGTG